MPETIDSIKRLFDDGDLTDKLNYLFEAVHNVAKSMNEGFKAGEKARGEIFEGMAKINASIQTINVSCGKRQEECAKRFLERNNEKGFITVTQARIFGIIVLIGALCFGIGAGYVSFFELVKHSGKLIAP